MADRCQKVQARLNERVDRISNSDKNTFSIAFSNIQARLQRLSDRLGAENIDTKKLNDDIATLATKIAALNTAHDQFIANLKDVQVTTDSDCGKTQGAFMAKLQGARAFNLTVEKQRLEIKSFIQTTIKADIMAIRAKIAADKKATTTQAGEKAL
jgi:ABC-type transporter Mla subunit MlaD